MDWDKIEKAINDSPEKIKQILFSVEFGEELGKIGELNQLNDDQILKMIDEVALVILNIKSRSSFVYSIIDIGVDEQKANILVKDIESKIFSKLDSEKNTIKPEPQKQEVPKENVKSYDSFEQTILRQAQAMRPAVAPEDRSYGMAKPASVPQERNFGEAKPAVNNSQPPTANNQGQPQPKNYNAGGDPYREPME